MIISPIKVLTKGWIVSALDCPEINLDKQIQQVGIDIRVNKLYCLKGKAKITEKEKELPEYIEILQGITESIRISHGAYTIDFMEYIRVPKNVAAFVIHRSSFNRSGSFITGSVFDSGFEGIIGGTMYVHNDIEIERGTRIAQVIFMEAESAKMYEGSYQKLRSHNDIIK